MIQRVLAFMLAMPSAALAEDSPVGALRWMAAQSSDELTFQAVGPIDTAPGGVIVVDPLTYDPDLDWPFVQVPAAPARFVVAREQSDDQILKALLVFSDADVTCGRDEASVGVDSGLAAFLDRPRENALSDDIAALGDGKDIYNDWFANLIADTFIVAQQMPLPSGSSFPMMSSGWGDGVYPLASLRDKDGAMVALYVNFMGKDDAGNWLLPPECDGLPVTLLELPAVSPSPP